MARPLRIQVPDAIYHVTSRGNERAAIYRDDRDRHRFMDELAEVRGECRWQIYSYCLMPNHFHLLLQTPDPNLAEGMRKLNGEYAQRFNRRHGRVGHLFQGRYDSRLVDTDTYFLRSVRYIIRNPVRARLCSDPAAWRWSSHRAALGHVAIPWLDVSSMLSYFGSDLETARREYLVHVESPGPDDAGRPDLTRLFHDDSGARQIARAQEHGYSLREIARFLQVDVSTVCRRLHR